MCDAYKAVHPVVSAHLLALVVWSVLTLFLILHAQTVLLDASLAQITQLAPHATLTSAYKTAPALLPANCHVLLVLRLMAHKPALIVCRDIL